MAANPRYKNRDWLRRKYAEDGLSQYEIADECGVTQAEISRRMNRLGIDTNDRSTAQNPDAKTELLSDEEWLRERYHGDDLTVYDIGDMCNVHGATVAKRLRKLGIETRGGTEKQTTHAEHTKFTDPDWLESQYWGEDRSQSDIAAECGVSQPTIGNYLRKFGIETRPKHAVGEEHPQWNGGYDIYQLKNWDEARERVFDKYGQECLRCGLTQTAHKERYGESIHVHHLEALASFDDPADANRLENLVPLCQSCHKELEGADVTAADIESMGAVA